MERLLLHGVLFQNYWTEWVVELLMAKNQKTISGKDKDKSRGPYVELHKNNFVYFKKKGACLSIF
jgi:hypothetical protein